MTWDQINCIERNGPIFFYHIRFHREEDGRRVSGMILKRTFTALNLVPNTNYTFQVAGVNSRGVGSLTETMIISTKVGGMNYVHVIKILMHSVLQLLLCLVKYLPPPPPSV